MGETFQLIALIVAGMGVILGMFYFVIGRLIDKHNLSESRLEEAKKQHTQETIGNLKKSVDSFSQISEKLSTKLSLVERQLGEQVVELRVLLKEFDQFVSESRKRLDSLENAELVPIGGNKFILRRKA